MPPMPLMTKAEMRKEVAELSGRIREAYYKEFPHDADENPEWAIWWAKYLQQDLSRLLKRKLPKSRIIYCLMDLDYERRARAPKMNRIRFLANQFVERFAPSETPHEDELALYQSEGCPYCAFVRKTIDDLGIDVELRDVYADPSYREELAAARGSATVPVLRITSPNEDERWMPQFIDIVRYLKFTYC